MLGQQSMLVKGAADDIILQNNVQQTLYMS